MVGLQKTRILAKFFITLCFLPATFGFAGQGKWTSQGPYGTGGNDTGKFVFHPTDSNLIFVGFFGGIWRSINGGEKWQRVYFEPGNPNLLPFYAQMTPPMLAIHPKEPNTIIAARFFGFGFYGVITIYKSSDRGIHWQVIHETIESPWDRYAYVTDLKFHSQDPNVLYVSFYRKGMIKSIDGGKNWRPINNGLPEKEFDGIRSWDCLQIEVDPTHGDRLYTLMPDGQVYKSENAGENWASANEGLRLKHGEVFEISSSNPQILYAGGKEGLYKSADGGSHWENLACRCAPASLAVDPVNPNVLYYTDWVKWIHSKHYRVFASTDAGRTWTDLPARSYRPSNAQIAVHPLKRNQLFIEDDEGIYRSTNFGKSWHPSYKGIDNEPIGRIAIDPSNSARILAIRSDITGVGRGTVFETQNGGGSWKVLLRTFFNLKEIRFHPVDPKVIVAVGGGIAISSDGGLTWRLSEGFSATSVEFDPENPDIIYLQNAKSIDRGRTWNELHTPDPQYSYSIFVHPNNGSILFLITFPTKLFRSTDAGETWAQIGRGFKDWDASLLFDPTNPQIIYAPGSRGIYKSLDLGNTWALKRNGLPSRYCCSHLVMDPTNSQVLYTVAKLNQIYVTKNGGENWTRFPSIGLEKVSITALSSHLFKPRTLFAGTFVNGVYAFRPTTNSDLRNIREH